MTIEDPVEYVFPSINQIQTNEQAGITFANGLRSILRQDPDVILVGEIRDVDTARIAVQSALTGHFVLSSLHATDSAAALHRFLDMGIESFLIASSVLAVVSQRLVRRICQTLQGALRAQGRGARLLRGERRHAQGRRSARARAATSAPAPATGTASASTSSCASPPRSSASSSGWATQDELQRMAVVPGHAHAARRGHPPRRGRRDDDLRSRPQHLRALRRGRSCRSIKFSAITPDGATVTGVEDAAHRQPGPPGARRARPRADRVIEKKSILQFEITQEEGPAHGAHALLPPDGGLHEGRVSRCSRRSRCMTEEIGEQGLPSGSWPRWPTRCAAGETFAGAAEPTPRRSPATTSASCAPPSSPATSTVLDQLADYIDRDIEATPQDQLGPDLPGDRLRASPSWPSSSSPPSCCPGSRPSSRR